MSTSDWAWASEATGRWVDELVNRTTVLVLGTGELSSELVLAFQRLGATVIAEALPDRETALRGLIDRHEPQVVVVQSAEVSADVLDALSESDVEVFPAPDALRVTSDRERLRKLAADELGLPTAPFWFAGSVDELTAVAEHAGLPLTVSPASDMGTNGRSVLTTLDDVDEIWERVVAAADSDRVMAETEVKVDTEFTLLVVRGRGPAGGAVVQFCEPIGRRRINGGPLELWQPHELSASALDAARSIAARIVNGVGGYGLFAVDLMVGSDGNQTNGGDEVYFAAVHPLLTGAGFVTTRSQRLSQFELHARAILGLPVDTIMISPAAGEVSSPEQGAADAVADALVIAESDVRLSSDVCVALATAPDVLRARDRARQVSAAMRRNRV
ncbi:ATP-grasp domain-containing protein [Mycobacterium sp. OTB74]|uniref:ATP-grasp domain-containing protein n=1 Tax=Mycobacterium sp. OTB74 TaxID=1853452 RepID=UPI002475FF87|nr:ATP-grasp domain-containing protein [Mycobacterium sp. OTB74]MDH6243848.1 phosphoribosylglycinamide formyltransferase 2 [Mycobacterium sp. OTB74]